MRVSGARCPGLGREIQSTRRGALCIEIQGRRGARRAARRGQRGARAARIAGLEGGAAKCGSPPASGHHGGGGDRRSVLLRAGAAAFSGAFRLAPARRSVSARALDPGFLPRPGTPRIALGRSYGHGALPRIAPQRSDGMHDGCAQSRSGKTARRFTVCAGRLQKNLLVQFIPFVNRVSRSDCG